MRDSKQRGGIGRANLAFLLALAAFAGVQQAAAWAAQPGSQEPLRIGLAKQLLVDDFIIDEALHVTRQLGKVAKANDGKPVLVVDKPWEDQEAFGCYGTVLHDGAKFRMWYRCFSNGVAYAESRDGVNWEKPNLGLYDFDLVKVRGYGAFRQGILTQPYAGKENNILGILGDAWCCELDPHETVPAHRYKAAHYPLPDKATHYGAALSHSADGIHWTLYNEGKPVTGRACDCYNQIVWDEAAKTYRLYTRQDFGSGGYTKLGLVEEIRGARSMTNPDVKADPANWTTVRTWKFDREGPEEHKRRQLMAMTNWIYEGIHFGLMVVYEWPEDFSEGPHDTHQRHERDILNFYIAPCRGGDRWDLSWIYAEKPLIPRGPSGSFDKDWVWHNHNIVTHDDRHWIYYTGMNERHWPGGESWKDHTWRLAIGLATLRLDGFVCLESGDKPGTVTTKPFLCEGTRLEVNADAGQGRLIVEVLDADGQPQPGFMRADARVNENVDALRLQPRWKDRADLATLKGKAVRLRFHLDDAQLYAFQIRP